MTAAARPVLDVDLYADGVLHDPYPHWAELRELGPAVWLPRHGLYALSRYADVRAALQDHRTFSSARGVAVDEDASNQMAGTLLASDPPEHAVQRKVLNDRLSPRALRVFEDKIDGWADEHVGALVERGSFDAVADLAQPFPVDVIFDLVGLPEAGREHMLEWAEAAFNAMGPNNERATQAVPKLIGPGGLHEYVATQAVSGRMPSGTIGAEVHEAVERGEIDRNQATWLLLAFATAGIDTTVNALSWAVWFFARHPDQWELVLDEPELIPSAFNEILRLESPITGFTRFVTDEPALGDVTLAPGDRVLLLFGSANRDSRKWDEPERFDVQRNPVDHLTFGRGIHVCVGQPLARLEGHAILKALARRVRRFETGEPELHLNNTVRGLGRLPVEVVTL